MCQRKLLLVLLVFLFGIAVLFAPHRIFASSNFNTDYHVTYTIDENGMAHAVVNGKLTNMTAQYFATSYKIQLGFDAITNIKAEDTGGSIDPQVTKSGNGYIISLDFNKKEVGLGNSQQFTITFDTPTIAHHYGKIWEISIPGIANPEDFSSFVVALKTPSSFGQPAYIKPKQAGRNLTFNKQTLGKSGISLAYGDAQLYSFHLLYHLHNPNLYPITSKIALPPSTNYQNVTINAVNPAPVNIIEDKDGNWLAEYHLSSTQSLDVSVTGTAVIHLSPKKQPMSSSDLSDYVKQQTFWEVNNQTIQQLAEQLQTPQAIYTYVSDKLHYDFLRVSDDKPRLGALHALENPYSAVCREFTDLFIAIARAAHIPAREIDGFAYTDNLRQRPLTAGKDILHVWPEYYDSVKKTWIMVDPTWGSTTGGIDYFNTLDYDHFAFAIKGESSVDPTSVGGYSFTNDPISKDVQVGFASAMPAETTSFSLASTFSNMAVSGLPISGNVIIKNAGSSYIPGEIVTITSQDLFPHEQILQTSGIPPFGYLEVPVTFNPVGVLTNLDANYTIRVSGTISKGKVRSKIIFLTPLGGEITIGLLAIIILITAFKSRRLRLFR